VCNANRERLWAQKHNLNRVHSLDGSALIAADGLAATEPTPSQLVLAQEEWDRLLRGQPPHYQRILLLLRQGHTQKEVAAQLRLNERTIRRVVEQAASRLKPEHRP
jgi:DNA-binding NarL/FixJ family response regulator